MTASRHCESSARSTFGSSRSLLQLQTGRQVVQDDCRTAYDDPDFQQMLDTYGGLAAQIVTPVMAGDRLQAVVSLHQLGRPRTWTAEEIAAATKAADRVAGLL